MQEINNIKVIASKGIVNDRYFKDNNDKDTQITLIESENIDYNIANLEAFSSNKNPSILLGSLYLIGEYKKRIIT